MTNPITVDLPHNLGVAEARRRIDAGKDKLAGHIPGGAQASSNWEGDRLHLTVTAMGQTVDTHIDVQEKLVRLEVMLPPMLAMFAGPITNFLSHKGGELLEDKRK
jgi:hypothetical protein